MHRTVLLAACALAACQPADRSGTVRAWLFSRDPATNSYGLRVGEADNLVSLVELRGRDVVVRRNTELTTTLDGLEIDRGGPFSLEYTLDDQGVVVPGDLHSFHALSLYRNLDHVAAFFRAHGFAPLRPLTVYYFPRVDNVVLGDSRLIFTDNAAFLSAGRGFLIVPAFVLSDFPMLLNEGVVGHEFGHAVIHQQMFGDALEVPHEGDTSSEWQTLSRHLISMHEGVADLIGFAVTGDPDYIQVIADVDRNLAEPKDFVQKDLDELDEPPEEASLLDLTPFDPHHQGSLLARAVYELWPKGPDGRIAETERGRMVDLILASLPALKYERGFTLASFPDELVRRLAAAEQAPACGVLRARLAPLAGRLAACEGL